jgi:DNA-binding PadR family transcriptional regulator
MKGDVLKGHLDMLLLAAVRAGPAHGYALIEELRRSSGGAFDLPEGTVYPALHRLERAGLLASTWSSDAPRRRRVYSLTDDGRAALAEMEREWARFAEAVAGVLAAVRA